MKPSLKTQKDVEFMWEHFDDIDIIESDHAPHTRNEKEQDPPPFGVPGLETTLPLLINEAQHGRLTIEQIKDKCYTKPKDIFHLPTQVDTYVEVDENQEYEVRNELLFTKCHWSPFAGRVLSGKVTKTVLRGEVVYEKGIMFTHPGSGQVVIVNSK